ncbi:hypothetical protein P3T27_002672 [Kitasatospora sp. MAA19]|uniref:hypothetical protein n=1 Tax=Kitasatospora sp. MAA19 TaxID=3035090 RepID=UPI002474F9E0|nr:hypothetical protein [Kitasatospora sp. MAA19]MDH6705950.1 hypothetical protein [Kitasatospora sp. MAA19]
MTTTPPHEYPHPVTVEIGGVTETATFTRLADALAAVRAGLAHLPLDDDHAGCLADLFAPEATARIAQRLTDVGALRAIAFVGLHAHPIYLRPADDTAAAVAGDPPEPA